MTCLVCTRREGTVVVAWTTNPIRLALCSSCQDRWQSVYSIPIRPDIPEVGQDAASSAPLTGPRFAEADSLGGT
jgi:hypothetical protein